MHDVLMSLLHINHVKTMQLISYGAAACAGFRNKG